MEVFFNISKDIWKFKKSVAANSPKAKNVKIELFQQFLLNH